MPRQKMERDEVKRLWEEKRQAQMEPISENEVVEWDGLRRRKTILNNGSTTFPPPQRRKTLHPPLGMSHFPTESEIGVHHDNERDTVHFFENLRHRAQNAFSPGLRKTPSTGDGDDSNDVRSPMHPVALTEIAVPKGSRDGDTPTRPYGPGSLEEAQEHIYGLPASLIKEKDATNSSSSRNLSPPKPSSSTGRPSTSSRRQFSFQNVFHRAKSPNPDSAPRPTTSQRSRSTTASSSQKKAIKNATEEERLGLVKGDSHTALPLALARSDSSSTTSTSSAHSRAIPAQSYYDNDKDIDTSYHAPPAAVSSYYPASTSAHPRINTRTTRDAYEEIDDSDEEWQIASKPPSQQTSPQRRRPTEEQPHHPLPRPPPPPPTTGSPPRQYHKGAGRSYDPYRLPPNPVSSSRSPPSSMQAAGASGPPRRLEDPPLTAFRTRSPEEEEGEEGMRIKFGGDTPRRGGGGGSGSASGGGSGGAFI